MLHHVRYSMRWGHKIKQGSAEFDVTRAEFNAAYGAPVPESPPMPDSGEWLWDLFWRLSSRRSCGESIEPISHGAIESFCKVMRESICPEEAEIIESLDNTFIAAVSEERKDMIDRLREPKSKTR